MKFYYHKNSTVTTIDNALYNSALSQAYMQDVWITMHKFDVLKV